MLFARLRVMRIGNGALAKWWRDCHDGRAFAA